VTPALPVCAPRALLAVCLLAAALPAQTTVGLKALPTGRGSVLLGEPAITSSLSVVAGRLGSSCAFADLDGDGLDDYIVGAPQLSSVPVGGPDTDAGHVYVLFGSSQLGFPGSNPQVDFAALGLGVGLDLRGAAGDLLGSSLAAAGDVDGDGREDLLIGAPGYDAPGRVDAGAAYLLFGAANLRTLGPDVLLVDLVAAGRARRLVGPRAFAALGSAAGGGGLDADNDGLHDVGLGAPLDSSGGKAQNGSAFVVFGDPSLKAAGNLELSSLGPGRLCEVRGSTDFELLGSSVAGLGRFDPVLPGLGGSQDLLVGDDIALGAPGRVVDGGLFTGAAYVLRGQASGNLPVLLESNAFVGGDSVGLAYTGDLPGDRAGGFVGSLGDLFGADGFVELGIGAPASNASGKPDAGAMYLIPGRFQGSNPQGFDLALIGPNDGRAAIQVYGATTLNGVDGVVACSLGDFDGDERPDLALAFPAATVLAGVNPMPRAGLVHVLTGSALDPVVLDTIDLAQHLSFVQSFRLEGDATSAQGGFALAAGDVNGDGNLDLGIGAPGAPSNPTILDPTHVSHLSTGRGQLLYGPLSRVQSITPTSSHFDGPTVRLTIYQLIQGGLSVSFGGVPATAAAGQTGSPGFLDLVVPAPLNPGAGETVDIALSTDNGSVVLPDAFTYEPLSITSGPQPTQALPDVELSFTGTGISSLGDMSVTVNGVPATVSASDPIAGSFRILAPGGQPPLVPLDVLIENSNGSVLLPGALSYQPFVVASVSPTSGSQASGIEVPPSSGFSFLGEAPSPVDVTLITSTGTAPADSIVEFGTDALGYELATVTAINGDVISVELPDFLLGPAAVPVDVRVTNSFGSVSLPGAFTYLAGDWRSITTTEKAGFGSIPECLGVGAFVPGGTALLVFQGHQLPETEFGVAFAGFALNNPFVPFFGGLLGPVPSQIRILPLQAPQFAFQLLLPPGLSPEGGHLYVQLVTQESDGLLTEWAHSAVLEGTIRFE